MLDDRSPKSLIGTLAQFAERIRATVNHLETAVDGPRYIAGLAAAAREILDLCLVVAELLLARGFSTIEKQYCG